MKLTNSSPLSEQTALWHEHSMQLNRAMWLLADELGLIPEGADVIEMEPDEIVDQTLMMFRLYKGALATMREDFQKIHDIVGQHANVGNMVKQDG